MTAVARVARGGRSDAGAGRPTGPAPARRRTARRLSRLLGARGLGLFSEVVVVSLVVSLCALPVVTALPAAAAGAAHLRRHIDGGDDGLGAFFRDLWPALRGGWAWGLVAGVAGFAVLVNTTSPMMDAVPGGAALRTVSLALAVAAVLVLLRGIAGWRRGARWTTLIRSAARRTASDLRGTGMLLLALALAVVVVWMFAPLVVVAPGLLLFAAVAVERANGARDAG